MEKKKWTASEMGRKGGSQRTPAKVAASRKNGRLGGLKPKCLCGTCTACVHRKWRHGRMARPTVQPSRKPRRKAA